MHHHPGDKLCPWEKVDAFWKAFQRRAGFEDRCGVYVNVMTVWDRNRLDKNFHNVAVFLLSQRAFWQEMEQAHPCGGGPEFVTRCKAAKLGGGLLTVAVEGGV